MKIANQKKKQSKGCHGTAGRKTEENENCMSKRNTKERGASNEIVWSTEVHSEWNQMERNSSDLHVATRLPEKKEKTYTQSTQVMLAQQRPQLQTRLGSSEWKFKKKKASAVPQKDTRKLKLKIWMQDTRWRGLHSGQRTASGIVRRNQREKCRENSMWQGLLRELHGRIVIPTVRVRLLGEPHETRHSSRAACNKKSPKMTKQVNQNSKVTQT